MLMARVGFGSGQAVSALIFACACPIVLAGETWVEDTFSDFADGQLDAAGQNLYVCHDGTVQTIHRFDLNQDGYLDLMFNSTHDEYAFIPATLCTPDKDRRLSQSPLAVEGSVAVAAADLNRDGWTDLVFCPNASGIQHTRRFVTLIYGGPDGWPAHRSNGALPVRGAKAIAIVDLNHDRWPDVAVLNEAAWLRGQPPGNIIRIFWGSKEGFLLTRRRDLGVPGAVDIASADLDGDDGRDLAVLTSDKGVRVLWSNAMQDPNTDVPATDVALPDSGGQCIAAADANGDGHIDLVVGTNTRQIYMVPGQPGRTWGSAISFSGVNASNIAVGDLDGDGQPDLVLTDLALARAAGGEITGAGGQVSAGVRIMWGDKAEFSMKRSTRLPVGRAAATAIGDLDGDGRADLVVAVYQGDKTFAAGSAVFFNQGQRRFERGKPDVHTEGCTGVAITPPEGRFPARAIFCNSRGGRLHEAVPLMVYWGGADGFDPNRRWLIPFACGYEASAADLNADGFVDLIATNSAHGGADSAGLEGHMGVNIFWGGADGFDIERRRISFEHFGLWATNVADLNRDGWLDLICGVFGSDKPGVPEQLIIYYGSADGFSTDRRRMIPSPGRSAGCAVADFNRDDWLDVGVTSYESDRVRIFWGGPNGFDEKRQAGLDSPKPIGLETADLNADGHLDLIVGSYADALAGCRDTGTLIFWGSDAGFRQWDAQRLPGWTPVGHTVADFDGDGYLDLFTPHYHGQLTRESLPSYLYWGDRDGLAPRRRTILICDSAADALAADFNRDGRLDLAVACHTVDGNHHALSRVFYNDGRRFTKPEVTTLPTHGAHWMWLQDMGHIYDRAWRQRYTSSIFKLRRPATHGTLSHKATVSKGTKLAFAVRAAADETSIAKQPWQDVTDSAFQLTPTDRCLQYRAVFTSDNGDRFPILDRVQIDLAP